MFLQFFFVFNSIKIVNPFDFLGVSRNGGADY